MKKQAALKLIRLGAAGVEVVLAMQYAKKSLRLPLEVSFIASSKGLLPGFSPSVISRVNTAIKRSGVQIHNARAEACQQGLLLSNGQVIHADFVFAATGVCAPVFLRNTKLALNQKGFIALNEAQQSMSHCNVFAAGDVGSRSIEYAKSGVHAGPVIARNLIHAMQGLPAQALYIPKKTTLYLLAMGLDAQWHHGGALVPKGSGSGAGNAGLIESLLQSTAKHEGIYLMPKYS